MQNYLQHEPIVKWYRDYGKVVRRVALGVAVALLSHQLLSLWPIYNPPTIMLCAVLIGLAGAERPTWALRGFLLAFVPSFLYGSGSLALLFVALCLVVLFIPKLANTSLKLTLILASPFALQHGWFFFAAILGGLVYANAAVAESLIGAVFGFLIAWLDGWPVVGVFPARASWFEVSTVSVPFSTLATQQMSKPDWHYLDSIVHGIAPYSVSVIAGIIIITLTTRLVAVLRKKRELRQDILSIFIPTTLAATAWTLMANEMHPSLSVALIIIPTSLLAGVVALLIGVMFPSWTEPPQLVAINSAFGSQTQPKSNSDSAPLPSRLRKAGWDEIAGYEDIKEELKEAVQPYLDRKVRRELEAQGLPVVGGILLYGAPGTGKTLFARVLASETNMRFFSVSGPEFFSKWVGESEHKLREIFAEARAAAPSVIFFDEVESFLAPRDMEGLEDGSSRVSRQVVATFLAEMDGVLSRGDVLVVAATNHPDQIDSAAIRSGRFDKIIFIPPPDEDARRAIITSALRKRKGRESIAIEPLVAMTERFTAADITGILTDLYRAATQQGRMVTQDEIESLFKQTKPTVTFQMLAHYGQMQDKFGRRSRTSEHVEVVTHERLDWHSIGGMEDAKAALREAVELPLLHPELFSQWGVKPHKGVLLYGPSGCGKTMFARVVSDTSNSRFYTINGPELLGGGVGAAEQRLREVFERAKENKPAIIFFDEIDAIASSRDSYAGAIQGPVVQQLLTLMDGKEALNGVVVIAATNRPDQLDAALLRPGRFDRLIYVPLPDDEARLSQWRMHLAGKPGADSLDYEEITAASVGYSSAEIEHIVNKVAMASLKASLSGEDCKSLATTDILDAIARTPAQISPKQIAAYEAIVKRFSR